MVFDNFDTLIHYGVGHLNGGHSGRYPYGSGDEPYQHQDDFYNEVNRLRAENFEFVDENGKRYFGDTAIAKSMKMSTTEFRVRYSMEKDKVRESQVETVKKLKEDGFSTSEIGRKMGLNESTIRSLLDEHSEKRMKLAEATASHIKDQIDSKGIIDISSGVEAELGISRVKLNEALYMLKEQGYEIYNRRVPQATNPGMFTTMKVICPPGTEYKDIYDYEKINSLRDYKSYDDGETFKPSFQYPSSMDSKRLAIRYSEDGGSEKDGVIELRRGVPDLYLGDGVNYAQVRILVDGTHYLKGMAVYSDDIPSGKDVLFNTNKTKDIPMNKVLKSIKTEDPNNPFGALIKEVGGQSYYIDKDGKEKLSLINKRAEEGDFLEWSNKLSAQFLSKQNIGLIKNQLNLSIDDKKQEFDEIMSVNNPTVKRKLLETYASDCDASAVHLKAAALPRQQYQVILPIPSLKETEVYAPNYKDGEKVALIRYPHGGTFEIPVVTVNNKNAEGNKVITKNAKDAIGINKKVADILSGADFDGDTVMVIPVNTKTRITSRKPLRDLEGFDPKMEYPERKGMKYMKNTQNEMGRISNLINDMTLAGATDGEVARAVKHSMVVIDAEKHKLDYQKSYKDNDIYSLKKKYQGHYDENGNLRFGASTLISRSKGEISVVKRQGTPKIAEDGSLIFKTADDAVYVDYKTGKTKIRMQKSTQMAETKDARTLISKYNSPAEVAYADYANKLKSMANQARKELLKNEKLQYDGSAAKRYSNEVKSLDTKLNISEQNAPRERKAQVIANNEIKKIIKDNPDITKKEIKKISQQKLTLARNQVGAKRTLIDISDSEWEAIQAGAISDNKLQKILRYADIDKIRERATPRSNKGLNEAKIQRIKTLKERGYTNDEIASRLGVSSATINKYS